MLSNNSQAALVEALRPKFEAYFLASRKSKGVGRVSSFARLPDGTYADDHTQRHWWTYQQAVLHTRAALAQAEAAPQTPAGEKR